MLGNKPMRQWLVQYGESHQHPVNRLCHIFGIPMIAVSLPLFVVTIFVHGIWPVPVALFVIGWTFQFVGHLVEGKPPEFGAMAVARAMSSLSTGRSVLACAWNSTRAAPWRSVSVPADALLPDMPNAIRSRSIAAGVSGAPGTAEELLMLDASNV